MFLLSFGRNSVVSEPFDQGCYRITTRRATPAARTMSMPG